MLTTLLKMLRNVSVVALLLSASAAHAGLYQFNLTGDYTASWQMQSTVQSDDSADGVAFVIYDVEGSFPGTLLGLADLYFYNGEQDGGFEIYDYYNDFSLIIVDGPQLYSGSELMPTFLLGTFSLVDSFGGAGSYTLTVTDLDAGPVDVPEPATAAMLIGGLGLLAAARKRRRNR